jgi:molybdate transport system substrate-binding protein
MFRRTRAVAMLVLLLQCASVSASGAEPVRVYAAASLTDALTAVAAQWQQQGHPAPRLVFGGTATLARQLEAGAPADVFAAADPRWMDRLDAVHKLAPGSRVDVLGNALVLVAPKNRSFRIELERDFPIAGAFAGKLCLGEPGVVPAGTYARQALQNLGWWHALQDRVVGTEDVRAALALVARGECAAGIVYATDAATSDEVAVVTKFPVTLHAPIVYPFAVLAGATPSARPFLEFVRSERATQVFRKYGFVMARTER